MVSTRQKRVEDMGTTKPEPPVTKMVFSSPAVTLSRLLWRVFLTLSLRDCIMGGEGDKPIKIEGLYWKFPKKSHILIARARRIRRKREF
jgi:hypothetical protein